MTDVIAACYALASEGLKNFVCVTVVCLIASNGLMYLKDPFLKFMSFFQKKVSLLRKTKKPSARVPQPFVLKVDSRLDIERWINQARIFVNDFDEGRRAEVVMMLVNEQLRDRLESHCFVDKLMQDDERVEYLFKVIQSMYKKKEGSPIDNKDRFLSRKQRVYKHKLFRLIDHRIRRRAQGCAIPSMARDASRATRGFISRIFRRRVAKPRDKRQSQIAETKINCKSF